MSSNQKPNSELLLSVLEYLDRNGYKESFDNLLTDTGIRYLENIRRTIDDLLKQKKLDELIIYINTCDKLTNDEKNNFLKILKKILTNFKKYDIINISNEKENS